MVSNPLDGDLAWPDFEPDIHVATHDFRVVSGISWQQDKGLLGRIFGYRRAVDILYQSLTASYSRYDLDTVVFPYVMCWRHYLELQLKSLLVDFRGYYGESRNPGNTHNIDQLWKELRPLLTRFDSTAKSAIKHVGSAIKQISDLDPNGENFRYDTHRDGSKTLVGIDGINLAGLHKVLSGVANLLEGAHEAITAALDEKHEMESYYRE